MVDRLADPMAVDIPPSADFHCPHAHALVIAGVPWAGAGLAGWSAVVAHCAIGSMHMGR